MLKAKEWARLTLFLTAGLCFFAAALVLALIVAEYITNGAGVQFFSGLFSPASIFVGLVHLLGFGVGVFLCFVLGVGLCAHGLVPPLPAQQEAQVQIGYEQVAVIHPVSECVPRETGPCCVRCEAELGTPVHLCPECGWTQPPVLEKA